MNLPIGGVRRSALVDQVIGFLRAQISSGAWPVGSRIPTEPALVETLGVARNTIREAVRALAHNGLLDIRQGSGTYVRATSELAEVMRRRFADADRRSIAELRAALESAAAALAAERRTPDDLELLDDLLATREAAWTSGDRGAFVVADSNLHLAVVAASHNPVITALYADLVEVVRDFLTADLDTGLSPERYVDHSRLITAIRQQQPETAVVEAGGHAFSWEHEWLGDDLQAGSGPRQR